jgi:hypothetical protein
MAEEDRAPEASIDESVAVTPTELVDTAETVGDDHDHAEGRGLPVARLLDGVVTSATIADGTIVNADVSSSAGIVVSKLDAGGTANRVVATTDGATMAMQQVVAAMIAADTITAGQLAPGSVGTSELVDGAVTDAKLASQKVAQLNPTYLGFGAATDKGSGFFDIAGTAGDAPVAGRGGWLLSQTRHWNWGGDQRWQLTCALDAATMLYTRSVIAGAGSAWHQLWHSGNDGAGSTLDADLLDGQHGTYYATATALAAETAARISAISAINSVPSGLVAAFRTAAEIPAGWTRETALDGKVMLGAGTGGGESFTQTTDYGTTWTQTFGSQVNTPAGGAVQAGSGSTAAPAPHSHDIGPLSFVPPSRAYVYARKS